MDWEEALSRFAEQPPGHPSPSRGDDTSVTIPLELSPTAQRMLRDRGDGKSACLVVLQGADVGSVIALADGAVIVGRSDECDAVLRGEGVSRLHARVLMTSESRVMIQDLGSTNGTFVEGERISEAVLHPGDKVLLGRETVLKFVYQDRVDELYQKEIYDSVIRDGLTGIYNRKYIDERLETELSLAIRQKLPFSYLLMDIDKFKNINDKFGHQTGDHVLISVVAAVSKLMTDGEIFGRFGGEEFAIIAPGLDGRGARVLGEKVRRLVAGRKIAALDGSGENIKVTASLGVVTLWPTEGVDMEEIVSKADDNLYSAKKKGRNRVIFSEILSDETKKVLI